MSDFWVNFATYGDPNGAVAGAWLPYDPRRKPYMKFGVAGAEAGEGLMKEGYEVLEQIYRKER